MHTALKKKQLPQGWYDGEIVVVNERGVSDFGTPRTAFDNDKTRGIVYYLFDIPYWEGVDLRKVPREARRAQLQKLLAKVKPLGPVRLSEVFDASLQSVVTSACKLGCEGVIAKRRGSAYDSSRSADWLKLKCSLRQEFVIGGWTETKGARSGLGPLLLGVHNAMGELVYAGNDGTGFSDQTLTDLKIKLGKIASTHCLFGDVNGVQGKPNWVLQSIGSLGFV